MTIWKYHDVGHSQEATKELKQLFDGNAVFDYPKPVKLVKRLIQLYSKPDSLIIDFFGGSSTTAQAVIEANMEDGGNRHFLIVQVPSKLTKTDKGYSMGYESICDIGEARIQKVLEKFNLSKTVGYRVFKLDSSNMENIFFSHDEIYQERLFTLESNVKKDRTDLDLLFGCLLEWGLELSRPYISEEISGVVVHAYDDNALTACFAEDIPEQVIMEIAKRQPLRAVFRDSGFIDDAARVNVTEIFKLLSPDTEVKVL